MFKIFKKTPEKIIHEEFEKIQCIKHIFYTKNGGYSKGIHSSLNFGYSNGDKWNDVKKNRLLVSKEFGIQEDKLITGRQISKWDVMKIETDEDIAKFHTHPKNRPSVDGMATKRRDIAIGVGTADCLPILMVDDINKVIGVAHGGWKPAKGGVIENVINSMRDLGAETKNIKACLGPCIRQKSYEVDKKFYDLFLEEDKGNSKFFIDSKNANHFMFDLARYSVKRLKNAGIEHIFDTGHDTYSEENKFFSFRRNCHRGEKFQYGVQLSVISLRTL